MKQKAISTMLRDPQSNAGYKQTTMIVAVGTALFSE